MRPKPTPLRNEPAGFFVSPLQAVMPCTRRAAAFFYLKILDLLSMRHNRPVESIASAYSLGKAAFSVPEFCASVSIGRTTFYQQVKDGRIRVAKIGRRTLIPSSEVDRWLNAATVGGEAV